MLGNIWGTSGYSEHKDAKGPASGGHGGFECNHAWVGFGTGHGLSKGKRKTTLNVLLNSVGYQSPFPDLDEESKVFDPDAPPASGGSQHGAASDEPVGAASSSAAAA